MPAGFVAIITDPSTVMDDDGEPGGDLQIKKHPSETSRPDLHDFYRELPL